MFGATASAVISRIKVKQEFGDARFGTVIGRVVESAKKHGKHVMTTIGNKPDADYGCAVIDRGVHAVVLGTDGHLFLDVCRHLNAIKGAG